MLYPHVNNVFNFQVNSVFSNAAVDFGHTIERGHSVNEKRIGGQNLVMPAVNTPVTDFNTNIVNDPNVFDQPQRGVN